MPGKNDKNLIEELSELILKQQLNILTQDEKWKLRSRLRKHLQQEGYPEAAELAIKMNKTEEDTKYLVSILNKVFPCSKS